MLPPLVQRALDLEREHGDARPRADDLGPLLHVLAAERGRIRVAAISTEAVAAAWIVSALATDVPFFAAVPDGTDDVEIARLFADDPHVRLLRGDWRRTLPSEAPFDLLVVAEQGLGGRVEDVDLLAGLLAPGGLGVLTGDAGREAWLAREDVVATAVSTGPGACAMLVVRR